MEKKYKICEVKYYWRQFSGMQKPLQLYETEKFCTFLWLKKNISKCTQVFTNKPLKFVRPYGCLASLRHEEILSKNNYTYIS